MHVEEYVLRYRMYRNDPKLMWEEGQEIDPKFTPDLQICFELTEEIKQIVIRDGVTSAAVIAEIVRDQEFKWQDIRRQLKDPKIKQASFLDTLKKANKLLHEAYIEYRELRRVA